MTENEKSAVDSASKKGCIVIPIEFDPRFIANIKKVGPQIGFAVYPNQTYNEKPKDSAGQLFSTSTNILVGEILDEIVPLSNVLSNALQPIAKNDSAPKSIAFEVGNARIWGGVALDGSDPFPDGVAVVGGQSPNINLCSGDLIAKDVVITAGHCWCAGVDEVRIGILAAQPIQVIKIDKSKSVSFKPCNTLMNDYESGDVALLKLVEPTKFARRRIGGLKMVLNAAAVRAVGFGDNNNGIKSTVGLKFQVNIGIVSWQCDGDN